MNQCNRFPRLDYGYVPLGFLCRRNIAKAFPDALKFCHTEGRCAPVEHRVAVRADRAEVLDRIDVPLFGCRSKGGKVMHMNESAADDPVGRLEIESAHAALGTVYGNAGRSRLGIALCQFTDSLVPRSFLK